MEEPPSSHSIHVINESDLVVDRGTIQRAISSALEQFDVGPSSVAVLITSDDRVRRLNAQFRGVDEPTDVLSFPDGDGACGDIAIAAPLASRQAAIRNIAVDTELIWLAIHGTLHLVGLNDETDAERTEMVRQMCLVADRLGIDSSVDWHSLDHSLVQAAGQ